MRKLAAFPRADEWTNTFPFELLTSVKFHFSQGGVMFIWLPVGFSSYAFSIAQVIIAPNYRTTVIYDFGKKWNEVVATYFNVFA